MNVYFKSDVFQASPKTREIFGLLVLQNLWPRTFEIAQSGHAAHK